MLKKLTLFNQEYNDSLYDDIFASALNTIKLEGRYRELTNLERLSNKQPIAFDHTNNKEVVLWCINDYLSMGMHPKVISAANKVNLSSGIGSGGTRNIGGSHTYIKQLENELSSLHKKEASLVFTSGYVANDSMISTLAKMIPNCVFFSDQANHSSIINGIKRYKSETIIFNHQDINDLEKKLQLFDLNRPKIIIFESVYSMDGSITDMKKITDLAKKYNSLTIVDEVHAVGLYGKHGGGISELQNTSSDISIIMGTLAKGFGAMGGYISASKDIINFIRSYAVGFIFTTSLPPSITAAAIASIQHLKNSSYEREALFKNVDLLKTKFRDAKINFLENNSHMIPIIIGDPVLCKEISDILLNEFSIFIQHINYPTVAKGSERLRITPNPFHTEKMINDLIYAIKTIFKRFDLI